MSWVYVETEPDLFTVGFYDPKGKWHTDSDHDSRESAGARVAYLNGGSIADDADNFSDSYEIYKRIKARQG